MIVPMSPSSGAEPPRTQDRNRPTLEQVAARAGVSRATVSRVVNHAPSVDPRLAALVQQAIEELRYVPNQAARALMTRRVDTVALVAAESNTRVFGDPFFAAIVRGTSQELGRAGIHLVLSMAQTTVDLTRVEAFLRGGHVDGALVISEHESVDVIGQTLAAGIPVVVGGRPLTLGPETYFVDHDNVKGAALAVEHLVATGRTRIGTVTGPQDMSAGIDRLMGFREALGQRFDPELVEEGDFSTPSGTAAVERLLRRRPDVDALFVASDMMALGAMGALRSAGRRIPDDVAVVGFDDAEVAAVSAPSLTTIRQRTVDQGRLMAQLLLQRLGRNIPEPMPELERVPQHGGLMLDVELIVRESA